MQGNIAATYTLVYHFLKNQSQNKAAEAVRKAAKAYVILRADVEQEGPPLEDIVKQWKAKQNTNPGHADSSSEDSESSDESSSSSHSSSENTSSSESESDDTSDSDDSSHDSDEGTNANKSSTKKVPERDTSATLSSAGENARKIAKEAATIPEKKSTEDKNKGSELDSSDSDSSSESSSSDSSDAESSSSGSGSPSSSDSSDHNDANSSGKAAKGPSSSESSSKSGNESDSESQRKENAQVAKKRKTLENGAAVTTAIANGSQQIARVSQKKDKPPPKVKERFQRVKVQNVIPELLLNNDYEARGGSATDYGERAHRDLVVTRGAGFRKEKNKKKRGSYQGGVITMESHSIKFDF